MLLRDEYLDADTCAAQRFTQARMLLECVALVLALIMQWGRIVLAWTLFPTFVYAAYAHATWMWLVAWPVDGGSAASTAAAWRQALVSLCVAGTWLLAQQCQYASGTVHWCVPLVLWCVAAVDVLGDDRGRRHGGGGSPHIRSLQTFTLCLVVWCVPLTCAALSLRTTTTTESSSVHHTRGEAWRRAASASFTTLLYVLGANLAVRRTTVMPPPSRHGRRGRHYHVSTALGTVLQSAWLLYDDAGTGRASLLCAALGIGALHIMHLALVHARRGAAKRESDDDIGGTATDDEDDEVVTSMEAADDMLAPVMMLVQPVSPHYNATDTTLVPLPPTPVLHL